MTPGTAKVGQMVHNDTDGRFIEQQQTPAASPDGNAGSAVIRGWWFVTLGICLILSATALLPLLPVDLWWIRIGDYPRVQLLLAYCLGILALIPFWQRTTARWMMALLVACLGVQLYWIFPYLPVAPTEVEAAQSSGASARLRILTANVLQENHNTDALLKLIEQEQPDIVVLCEVNQYWIEQLAPLEQQFAFHLTHPLENTYGIALYSNVEVLQAEVRGIIKDEIPSIDARIKLPSGQEVRLFAVHPNPPRPGEDTTKRDAELVLVGREIRGEPSAIVLGDMNDVGWSRTTNLFQEVSGLLDPRKGRGMYSTFNAHSWIWRYPLDHLFHSDDFRLVSLRRLSEIGSDHFPLFVELSHEPQARHTQEAPELNQDDEQDAQQAVDAAGTASCWGSNSYGQLGDGTMNNALVPIAAPVAGVSWIGGASFSSGTAGAQTCAIVSGTVRCWGDNQHGQLGDGTETSSTSPVTALGISDAVEVAMGRWHVCALRATGRVLCWGNNPSGEVGSGTSGNEEHTPVDVGLDGVVHIAAGGYHACAITASRELHCWGLNTSNQLGFVGPSASSPMRSFDLCP